MNEEKESMHTHIHLFSFGISKNSFASGNDAESCRTTFAESFFLHSFIHFWYFSVSGVHNIVECAYIFKVGKPDELKIWKKVRIDVKKSSITSEENWTAGYLLTKIKYTTSIELEKYIFGAGKNM